MKLSDVFTFFICLCISNLDKRCVMALCTLIRTPKGVGGAVKTKGYEKTFSLNETFTTVR